MVYTMADTPASTPMIPCLQTKPYNLTIVRNSWIGDIGLWDTRRRSMGVHSVDFTNAGCWQPGVNCSKPWKSRVVSENDLILLWWVNTNVLHKRDTSSNMFTTSFFAPHHQSQWIGLRENLKETIDFTIKYRAFL